MKRNSAIAVLDADLRMASSNEMWRLIMFSLLMAGVLAGSAMISIITPFSPVPVTFQVAAVLLTGLLLGPVWGTLSVCMYISAGLLGAPVFSMGISGPSILVQPSFGYLLGFPAATWVTGTLASRMSTRLSGGLIALFAGIAVIYLFGFLWLAGYIGLSGMDSENILASAWMMGIAPFILVDILKALLVAGLYGVLRNPRRRQTDR